MPSMLDELRHILVELWGVASPARWSELASQFGDPSAIIGYLASETRFRLSDRDIAFVTPDMKQALDAARPRELFVELRNQPWLKLQLLRSGGQGEVWIACPCDSGAKADQLVALKSPRAGANPAIGANSVTVDVQQLQREIDILGQIDCDNIARLVDADRPSGVLATQYVDGECLEKKLKAERRLSIVQTIRIGIDICHALEALHATNWIHKDVKPDNIILDESQRAILIDFGLPRYPLWDRPWLERPITSPPKCSFLVPRQMGEPMSIVWRPRFIGSCPEFPRISNIAFIHFVPSLPEPNWMRKTFASLTPRLIVTLTIYVMKCRANSVI